MQGAGQMFLSKAKDNQLATEQFSSAVENQLQMNIVDKAQW